jgi:hypothetical protein
MRYTMSRSNRTLARLANMNDQRTFWFGVKRYGYGWGLPVRWQGWVVLVGYFVLLFGGIYHFKPELNPPGLFIYIVLLTVALVAIIAIKGERPVRWRWGRK